MKAIIPIAGLGTRLLPLTKNTPKAMLPIGGKPAVQWIIEELIAAGVTDIIFVMSPGQESAREYFSEPVWKSMATFHFVMQKEPLGDGHAILMAKEMVKDEPFLVIFGDCLVKGAVSIPQLLASYRGHPGCKVGVKEIPGKEIHEYGMVEILKAGELGTLVRPIRFVEKPIGYAKKTALAIVGRYLLDSEIWPHLEAKKKDSGEMRIIDALISLQSEKEIMAVLLEGEWLDTGTMKGYQKAQHAMSR